MAHYVRTLLDGLFALECLGVWVNEFCERDIGGAKDVPAMEGLVRFRSCSVESTFGTTVYQL